MMEGLEVGSLSPRYQVEARGLARQEKYRGFHLEEDVESDSGEGAGL